MLMAGACSNGDGPDVHIPNAPNTPQSEATVSLDQVLGEWSLVSINGSAAVRAEGLDQDQYVGFEIGQPCYELGETFCNPDNLGWDPAAPQQGRFSFQGFSGCNGFGAEARLVDGRSDSKPILSTQMACPKVSEQESHLFRVLSSQAKLTLKGDRLFVGSPDGDQLELLRNDAK